MNIYTCTLTQTLKRQLLYSYLQRWKDVKKKDYIIKLPLGFLDVAFLPPFSSALVILVMCFLQWLVSVETLNLRVLEINTNRYCSVKLWTAQHHLLLQCSLMNCSKPLVISSNLPLLSIKEFLELLIANNISPVIRLMEPSVYALLVNPSSHFRTR